MEKRGRVTTSRPLSVFLNNLYEVKASGLQVSLIYFDSTQLGIQ